MAGLLPHLGESDITIAATKMEGDSCHCTGRLSGPGMDHTPLPLREVRCISDLASPHLDDGVCYALALQQERNERTACKDVPLRMK